MLKANNLCYNPHIGSQLAILYLNKEAKCMVLYM